MVSSRLIDMQYIHSIKQKVKNTVIGISLLAGAATAASLYVGYKTAKTAIKIPAALGVNSFKKLKSINKCCPTMFDTVKNNHKECFDKYFEEHDFDLAVESIISVMDKNDTQVPQFNTYLTQELNDARENVEIEKEDFLNEYQHISNLSKKYIEQCKLSQDFVFLDLIQFDNSTINTIYENKKLLKQYNICIRFSELAFGELLRTRYNHKINMLQRQYKYDSFISFINGCLDLFSSKDMCEHVLSKIPLKCFDKRVIQYVYQIYYNQNQHDICSILSPDRELFTPMITDIKPSKFKSFVQKIKNSFKFEDTHNIFENHKVHKQSSPNSTLTKEELDRCLSLFYQTHHHKITNTSSNINFWIYALSHKNSIYLRSFLLYYGQYSLDKVPITIQVDFRTYVQDRIIKQAINQDKIDRDDKQHFIMQQFLVDMKRYHYIDRTLHDDHTDLLRLCFTPEIKTQYKTKRSKLSEVVDSAISRFDMCSDIQNIILDYAL